MLRTRAWCANGSNELTALPAALAEFTGLVELLSVCDNRLQVAAAVV